MMRAILLLLFFIVSCGGNDSGSGGTVVTSSGEKFSYSPVAKSNPEDEDVTHVMLKAAQFNANTDLGWKLVFEDNFDDKATAIAKGADPSCFSATPECMINWWASEPCPEFATQLSNLNKCTWRVYYYYNYMDFDLPEGEGVNSFHPNQVSVQNGYLTLSAEASHYTKNNCKKPFQDPRINHQNYTIECPIISGAVESRKWGPNKSKGRAQEYGRFEVRAKLNNGPGAWPAHWLLPENSTDDGCGWPHSGEIDIMESWINKSHKVSGNLHSGHCDKDIKINKGFSWKAKSKWYPNLTAKQRDETFFKDFHTYAVEWDASKVRFLVDDHYLGQVNKDDIIKNSKTPKGGLPMIIPKGPFYWILNTTIYNPSEEELRPNKSTFTKQFHIIDYVKSYQKCGPNDPPQSCIKVNYKNTDALCPGIRDYLGDHNSKSLCKAWPNFGLSLAKCLEKGGVAVQNGDYCALDEGQWYKARSITRKCPWPREYVGWKEHYPVCKAWPHFKIKQSNCDGEIWSNYCIWSKGTWWRARELK